MKNKINFRRACTALMLSGSLSLSAQCPAPTNAFLTSQTSGPSSCDPLKQAFVPTSNDRVITIALNFWVFKDNNGGGNWGTVTEQDMDATIVQLNALFTNLEAPHYPVAGVQNIPDSKIRFEKKNFYTVNNTNVYTNYYSNTSLYNVNDCNAINIVFAKAGSFTGGNTPNMPGKYVNMPASGPTDYLGNPNKPQFLLTMNGIAHEICHALGLNHTSTISQYSAVKPNFGVANSCCDLISANDVHLETISPGHYELNPLPGDEWGNKQQDCNWTGDPNYVVHSSNNVMGYNDPCRRYLSPYQIALIHYHLRTDMKDVLTSQGYWNATTVDHNFDYTLQTDETWNSDRYMKGDLIVPAGKILTINCNVAMTQKARVVVMPKGQLILNGRLTNISGHLWSGVQVGGNSSQNQSTAASGFYTNQGVVRINFGTITHAENALKNYMTDINLNPIWSSPGGVVIATNAQFENNTRDMEFYTYNAAPSACAFTGCNFKITGAIGQSNDFSYAVPMCRVSLWDVTGVTFKACSFYYSAGAMYAQPGNGITSYDASWSLDANANGVHSSVTRFQKGVYSIGVNPLRRPTIKNTSFLANTEDAVNFKNITSAVFENNQITSVGADYSDGLYLNSCSLYNVRNNLFKENTGDIKNCTGISAYNSGGAGHSHQIYNNKFNNLSVGIKAIGDNSGSASATDGLVMNCNDFSAVKNVYDIGLYKAVDVNGVPFGPAPTVMTNQGNMHLPFNQYSAVRNHYGASSTGPNGENQWFIFNTSIKTYQHPVNSDAYTNPSPQPAFSDVAVHNVPTNLAFNPSACPAQQVVIQPVDPNNMSSTQVLQFLNDQIRQLQDGNDKDNNNDVDIKTCVAAKLDMFLTDSIVQNNDSVINLLKTHQGNIGDADILTVFAYLNNNDLDHAQEQTDQLDGSRENWRQLLNHFIQYKSDPEILANLANNSDELNFLTGYTVSDDQDGYAAAQSVLQTFGGMTFYDPKPEADADGGDGRERKAHIQTSGTTANITSPTKISVFPNPASDFLSLSCNGTENKMLQLDIKDALGRSVYKGTIKSGDRLDISLAGMANGVYLLSAYDNNVSVYQTKVIFIK